MHPKPHLDRFSRSNRRHEDQEELCSNVFLLDFASLRLKVEPDCPADLRHEIEVDAARIQARRGESFQVSAVGQTVLLGSELARL